MKRGLSHGSVTTTSARLLVGSHPTNIAFEEDLSQGGPTSDTTEDASDSMWSSADAPVLAARGGGDDAELDGVDDNRSGGGVAIFSPEGVRFESQIEARPLSPARLWKSGASRSEAGVAPVAWVGEDDLIPETARTQGGGKDDDDGYAPDCWFCGVGCFSEESNAGGAGDWTLSSLLSPTKARR